MQFHSPSNRLAYFYVEPKALFETLKSIRHLPLPEDTTMLTMFWDRDECKFLILVYSEKFDVVEGDIPELKFTYRVDQFFFVEPESKPN